VRDKYGTDCTRLKIIRVHQFQWGRLPTRHRIVWYPQDLYRTKAEADKAVEANKLFIAAETAKEQARVKALLEDSRRRTTEAEAGITPRRD